MEYISTEDFLKQPKEVQKVFLKWWQPQKGDIYCNIFNNQQNNVLVINDIQLNISSFANDIKQFGFPLFTEGQLRKFIESKTKETVYTGTTCGGDRFIETENENFTAIRREQIMDKDLLMTYWKYACRLVKEEIEESRVNEAMKQSFIDNIHESIAKEGLNE